MIAQYVRFPTVRSSLSLEGELCLPESSAPVPGVVVAHPHPQRGGSMDSNVVLAVCMGAQRAGLATLRFNFRGVGNSEGASTASTEEVGDILGALAFLEAQPGVSTIGLAGYSFGARMCFAALTASPQIKALLTVAPPLREHLPADQRPTIPFHALVGDRDGLVSEGIERYASYLPDPTGLQVVPGTDHFWWGFEEILVDASEKFFAEHLSAAR